MTAAKGCDAVPSAEQQQALEEALDHLLDPLADEPSSKGSVGEEAVRARPDPIRVVEIPSVAYGGGPTVRDIAVRLRWSERGLFRVPRRVAGWAVGVAAFWGLVWIILSIGALR